MGISLSDVAIIEMLIEDNKPQEALKYLKDLSTKAKYKMPIGFTAEDLARNVRRLYKGTHITAERARIKMMHYNELRDCAFKDVNEIIPNINAQITRACENGLYEIFVTIRSDHIPEEEVPKLCEYYKAKGFYVEKRKCELTHRITIAWALTR